MDDSTRRRLNDINREFYRVTADDFDQTRGAPWPGWERLLPHLSAPLSALDVGCGNGRFGLFLAARLPGAAIRYHGQDSSPALLERARAALHALPDASRLEITLEQRDIVLHPPDDGSYDLVAAFGLLHHIPGCDQRLAFVRRLAERVRPGGLLAFACWRFYEYERFRERIVPWPDDLPVERHDYLLDWRRGQPARRYCHYVDDDEHAALVAAAGLPEILTYRADGQGGAVNRYSLLRRDTAAP